jgi:6,7-dimethyl-8-ribityllumazine synthase
MTTDSDEQAIARMQVKGSEAALVAIEMVNLLRDLA